MMNAEEQLLRHVLDELKGVRAELNQVGTNVSGLSTDVRVVQTEMKSLKIKVAGFAALVGSLLPVAIKKLLGIDI